MAKYRVRQTSNKRRQVIDHGTINSVTMREQNPCRANRLQTLFTQKWYEDERNFEIMTKISPKNNDRINSIVDNDRVLL
jgi:hypothetical protein